jgi:hypothetical protein
MKKSPDNWVSTRWQKGRNLATAASIFLSSVLLTSEAVAQYVPITESTLRTLCNDHDVIDFKDIPTLYPWDVIPRDIPCVIFTPREWSGLVYYHYNPKFFTDKTRKKEDSSSINRPVLPPVKPTDRSTPTTTSETSETQEPKNSAEKQQETFCGVKIEQLTPAQKELYDKLSPKERKELSSKITINLDAGQIEFTQIKLAIKNIDIAQNVTKAQADDLVKKMGNGWILARGVDLNDRDAKLDEKLSDYDRMILQLPWVNKSKEYYFGLLMGFSEWFYWTSQKYNSFGSGFAIRRYNVGFSVSKERGAASEKYHLRPVRDLP